MVGLPLVKNYSVQQLTNLNSVVLLCKTSQKQNGIILKPKPKVCKGVFDTK